MILSNADSIYSSGIKDWNTLQGYIYSFQKEDFENMVVRAPVLAILIVNIERGWNKEIEYRDSVKTHQVTVGNK